MASGRSSDPLLFGHDHTERIVAVHPVAGTGDTVRVYHRTPNHLNPIRRELALLAGFPDQPVAEDHCFAARVFPHLKTEEFIDAFMYDYLYRTIGEREEEQLDLVDVRITGALAGGGKYRGVIA